MKATAADKKSHSYPGVYEPGEYEVRAHTEYSKGNRGFQATYVSL